MTLFFFFFRQTNYSISNLNSFFFFHDNDFGTNKQLSGQCGRACLRRPLLRTYLNHTRGLKASPASPAPSAAPAWGQPSHNQSDAARLRSEWLSAQRRSPLDDKLDVTRGRQDLAQLGGSEAVGPAQGDSLGQPADVQLLRVHLEPRVGDLGRLVESQGFG